MNIKDIARIAGVSTSTVSKIMNHKDSGISDETRGKVLSVARQYHYSPYSKVAPNVKTWQIGVLLQSSVSFDTTLDGIMQTAQNNGYGVLVFNSYADADQEAKNINALHAHKVDGVIWEPSGRDSMQRLTDWNHHGVPWVTTGPNGGDASLSLPYRDAAYSLTEQLIARGHKSIGCLMTQGRRSTDFLDGFRSCLFDHHLNFDDSCIYYTLNNALIDKISNHTTTGFVSSHYRKALEFRQLMESLHYQLPEDASLVSIRNDTTEQLAFPGSVEISTCTICSAEFGSYLCNTLIDEIEKRDEKTKPFIQDFHLDTTVTLGIPPQLRTRKITVVGSVNIDTYLSVPRLPSEGTTVSTRTATIHPGGKGINQAVGVAKLGHRVALIGNVGSDTDSDYVYRALEQWGVDAAGVHRVYGQDTGKAYIFVDPRGDSMISILSGANASLSPSDIADRDNVFANTGYCLIQSEIPMDAVEAACSAAHHYGAQTILKPSSCDHLPDNVICNVDILIPNENELNTLVPGAGSIEDKANMLLRRGVGTVIVTLGEQGCYIRNQSLERYFPAEDFTPVDNTGAGDAFISALASYLLYGHDLPEAIRIATFAAGFSVEREGVIASLVDKHTLDTRVHQLAETC